MGWLFISRHYFHFNINNQGGQPVCSPWTQREDTLTSKLSCSKNHMSLCEQVFEQTILLENLHILLFKHGEKMNPKKKRGYSSHVKY